MEQNTTAPRRRFTTEERAKYIELYQQSGLTQRAFAQQQGLQVGTFHQWPQRAKMHSAANTPVFKELPMAAPFTAWAAEISLGQEVIVRLAPPATAELIAGVVKGLQRSC